MPVPAAGAHNSGGRTLAAFSRILSPAFPGALPQAEIIRALRRPIASPRLCDLAAGKKRILILLEDASRPARTAAVVRAVCGELAAARPSPARIEILFAGGAHAGLEEANIAAKLPPGLDLPVHHHDALRQGAYAGALPHGGTIRLNPLLLEADLRIGIGTVNFHPAAGFSGGAKLILPGAADLHTITALHSLPPAARGAASNPLRDAMEAAAAFAPLDFYLAMLARPDGGLAGLWAGAAGACEAEARRRLLSYALLPRPEPAGFCLVGMKPSDQSLLGFFKAVDLCLDLLAPDGVGVIFGACPGGAGRHLWRWRPEVIARTNRRLTAALAGRVLYLLAPGVTPEEARRHLPGEVVLLRDGKELAGLRRTAREPTYHVPFGPMTAFA